MLPSGFSLLRRWGLLMFPNAHSVEHVAKQVPWEQPTIRLYGRDCQVPRLTCWYGATSYVYSGRENAPQTMPVWLEALRTSVERECATLGLLPCAFNSVLLNYYRDGRDSVAYHADDEPELGAHPVIASLSIGAERKFSIKHRASGSRTDVVLGHGDLLLMYGRSQLDYVHAVPKTRQPVQPRVNLTFRWIH